MYSNDKITQSIADAVRKVMEEELKGNQHKIDANKNDKVDAHDFELLRKKKKVEEKVVNPYAVGMAAAMKSTGDKPPLKKSTIVKAHDIAKKVDEEVELDEAATRKEVKKVYSKKGNHIGTIYHVDNGKDKPFISAQYHHGGGAVDNRAKSHEDAEKSIHSSHEATVRNAKNRHAEAKKEYESTSKHLKSIPEEVQLSFTDLIESYKTGGLKSFFENFEVDVVEEEATSDEFVAELEKAKRKAAGKEKNEVAKAAVQAVQQEEVEQIDEISKKTLGSYIKKANLDTADKAEAIPQEYEQGDPRKIPGLKRKLSNRIRGVGKAVNRLAKEDVDHQED